MLLVMHAYKHISKSLMSIFSPQQCSDSLRRTWGRLFHLLLTLYTSSLHRLTLTPNHRITEFYVCCLHSTTAPLQSPPPRVHFELSYRKFTEVVCSCMHTCLLLYFVIMCVPMHLYIGGTRKSYCQHKGSAKVTNLQK